MAMHHYQLEPPKDWQEFERLCHRLWMEILKDPNTQLHGRQGQSQFGVDVYGTDATTQEFYGIQCKGKDKQYGAQVTEKELRAEVAKALTFEPSHPQVFILATTAARDRKIQKVARQITRDNHSTNKIKVFVYGWEDIASRIEMYPSIIDDFYPHYSSTNRKLVFSMGEIENTVNEIRDHLLTPSDAMLKLHSKPQVLKYFFEASKGLLNWPRTLRSNDKWIERSEEEDITIQFDADLSSSSIVLGDPGTGKSALLSKLAQSLVDDEEIVLAIKADQLGSSVVDFATLGEDLGLPGPVDECLKVASQFGRIFVFIDQLDTLSELVDVKTNRLSVLLNLVKQLRFVPNIHLVASSRPFEFDHDVRLSGIKAQKIQLSPLTWEVTEEVLRQGGVEVQSADQSFKSFLSKPSNLNFYLYYLKNNPEKHFASHIELYEDIWRISLGIGAARDRRAEFLLHVAAIMTTDAKQALPIVRYEENKDDIDFLVNAGLLVKNSSNKSFSFAHQTLQAFVWTRSFIRQNSSLKDFIITHQDNLNIRPKLSTALFYLRDADLDEYNAQITSILITDNTTIRRHVIHLMIECIGAHHDPNSYEVAALKHLSKDEYYQGRICKAVSGKVKWFDSFKNDVILTLMVGNSTSKFVATFILSSVLGDRYEEILKLIDQYWKTPEDVNLIFYVLRSANYWTPQILELAKYLVVHENVHGNVPGMLYHIAAEKSAAMAIELTAHFVNNRFKVIINTTPATPPPAPENASEIEQYYHSEKYSIRKHFESIMDFGHSWHDFEKVAAKAPKDFIENFWSFFLTGCEKTRSNYEYDNNSYHDCWGGWFHLSDEHRDYRGKYFAEALEQSIKLYASENKQEFLELYSANKNSEYLPVQRILMKGLIEIASEDPGFVLDELLADKRRMKLGSTHENKFTGTIEIIAKLSQYLGDSQRKRLQDYIKSYNARESEVGASAESKQWDIERNRKVRYNLLAAIGDDLLDESAKRHMQEEKRALGAGIEDSLDVGGVTISGQVSRMTEEQFEKAKDIDIIKCFRAFPDSGENDWPSRRNNAGALELSRTFEKFALKNPQKAIRVIQQLDIANLLGVGYGLIGISKSDIKQQELLDLIVQLDSVFSSPAFYDDAARAIANKLTIDLPLSEEWLERIGNWIAAKPKTQEATAEQQLPDEDANEHNQEDSKEEKISGVLWGHGKMYGVPSGNFQILQTITIGYLLRKEPLTGPWSAKIIEYIKRGDSVDVWRAFLALTFPRAVGLCKPGEIECIVDEIISSYPEITSGTELAFTFAECAKYVSENKLLYWLDTMCIGKSAKILQVYGEVLGVKWIINPSSKETNRRIDDLIQNKNIPGLSGLAFTLENVWQYRKLLITPLFIRLIELKEKQVTTILIDLLRGFDLVQSAELNAIIDSFISTKSFDLIDYPDSFIAHCMLPLIQYEPDRVARVCDALISANGKNLGDISTGASAGTSDMITIAITIHNMGKEYQKIGLDIFERLMNFDAYQIQDALKKIDALPQIRVIA
ncbi:hypothetical protein CAP35_12395 [Chitinophagaceae bacterium IBVUCB1]|nr:hypothetical protein CAP35_12395 [Chitinophagaceae bacterium IBVUCB1]